MKKAKWLLTAGSIATTAALPVVAISCNDETEKNKPVVDNDDTKKGATDTTKKVYNQWALDFIPIVEQLNTFLSSDKETQEVVLNTTIPVNYKLELSKLMTPEFQKLQSLLSSFTNLPQGTEEEFKKLYPVLYTFPAQLLLFQFVDEKLLDKANQPYIDMLKKEFQGVSNKDWAVTNFGNIEWDFNNFETLKTSSVKWQQAFMSALTSGKDTLIQGNFIIKNLKVTFSKKLTIDEYFRNVINVVVQEQVNNLKAAGMSQEQIDQILDTQKQILSKFNFKDLIPTAAFNNKWTPEFKNWLVGFLQEIAYTDFQK
ncbi:variable surface lipoprotein [Mycoplasma hafezii]|uniref:variable surface lipoprotein n=1 Tax=Mycoplasma hafezii TaxID=525886 RepID=UPI003CF44754